MKLRLIMVAAIAALLAETQALAETCKVETTRAPGEWIFVKVYDADTGKIVLQKAIMGGSSSEVTVSGQNVRIDSKLAGDIAYKSGPTTICKNGNAIKI